MPPIEVAFLVQQLLADPSSHLGAAAVGLLHPWSREASAIADLWDLTAVVGNRSGKPAPSYPRPFPPTAPAVDAAAVNRGAEAARAAGWVLPDAIVQRRINDLGG